MAGANSVQIGSQLPLELRLVLEGWRAGGGALYRRLAAALGEGVERGALLPGSRLPPERTLATQLGIGRNTVAAAYELLSRRALVDRCQGRGTEVVGSGAPPGGSGRVTELTTSLQRNIVFRNLGEPSVDAIDLVGARTEPSSLVREAIARAAAAVDFDGLVGSYSYQPLGYPPLRRAVASHLSMRGVPTEDDQILITSGAQQAISLVSTYYLGPNELAVLEDPTFPGAIDAFAVSGARILTVPSHETGVDVDVLAATLSRNDVRAVYLMPTFHNPTGAVMPEAARRAIARLGAATGVPIIEDETLAELAYGEDPPRSLAAFAGDAAILTVGSLSKLVWGGLRVGWIRAARATIGRLGRLKAVADLGGSLPSQAIATELLGQMAAIKEGRWRELRERRDLVGRLLERSLPAWSWREPQGGLAVWARLPAGSSIEFARVASREGVSIVPGSALSAIGACEEYVRLSFGASSEMLEEGLSRLARAWDIYAVGHERRSARDLRLIV